MREWPPTWNTTPRPTLHARIWRQDTPHGEEVVGYIENAARAHEPGTTESGLQAAAHGTPVVRARGDGRRTGAEPQFDAGAGEPERWTGDGSCSGKPPAAGGGRVAPNRGRYS